MSDRDSCDGERARTELVVSVIIATYNARQLLADYLASIAENPPGEPYEVIVVDDTSADGTSEMVRARFPNVRLLRNEIKRHYAFSNIRAFEYARGEYRQRQLDHRPACGLRAGRVAGRDDDTRLPQLCRLSLPSRGHQPCRVAV